MKGNVKLEPKAKGPKTDSITASREKIVQPLATEATGKAMKYERTGPQVFVGFLYDEVTVENVVNLTLPFILFLFKSFAYFFHSLI